MNEELKVGMQFFALTKENLKGSKHQIVLVDSDEGGDVLDEPTIYTWSLWTEEPRMTWVGKESEFRKIFKYIGWEKK